MLSDTRDWIVCQIGARERYAIARELHRRGQLAALCTDIWAAPNSIESRLASLAGTRGTSFRERYDPFLKDTLVVKEHALNIALQRIRARTRGGDMWRSIIAANHRFGERISNHLESSGLLQSQTTKKPPIVFAYSYAAREIFETARRFGCVTILGQIDAGPVDAEIVSDVAHRHGVDSKEELPPPSYWENWRRECHLADIIVVNSPWARECLIRCGVDVSKIHIVPLSYEDCDDSPKADITERYYPVRFSSERPLQLLFLGRIEVRKGVFELLEAMERLKELPVKLTMVGAVQERLRQRFPATSNVEWVGRIAHSKIDTYYNASDLFLLPTHCDGFALTQLEAQVHGLPVLASRHCGKVVVDGINGRLIDPVSTESIEELIRWAMENPDSLRAMSKEAFQRTKQFTAERSVDALLEAAEQR